MAARGRFGNGLAVAAPGTGDQADLVAAGERAAHDALGALDGATPDLACVFVCGRDAEEIATAGTRACEVTGAAATIGCSATGVIGAGVAAELTPAVSVLVGILPGARLRTFHLGMVRGAESIAVLGMPDLTGKDAIGILLADPWSFPVDGFVEMSNQALPGLPLVGGLAAGPTGREAAGGAWLCQDGVSYDDGAVGVLIGGPVDVATVVSQGCRPVGPPMVVTKADGNELLELAGTPAADKLQEIVRGMEPAERELALTGLQLGIAMDEYADEHGRGDFLIRGVGGIDRDRKSIVVGDLVDVGQVVRFQVRDGAAADDELNTLLGKFRDELGVPDAALLFSCNGRGRAMFPSADHDIQAVSARLGVRDVAGFFAAGEIGPVAGRNHLHGFTASILAFGARAGERDG